MQKKPIKSILFFSILFCIISNAFSQNKIEQKFDNKALPIYKLDKSNLLEFIDIFMNYSLGHKDIEFLVNQQKTLKDFPLGYIYVLDCLSRFPFNSKTIFNEENQRPQLFNTDIFVIGGTSKSVVLSDFKKIEGQNFKKYYDSIRYLLDTTTLKKIKVIVNSKETTELDDTFNKRGVGDHIAEAYLLNYKNFSNFVKHNPVTSISITLEYTEKKQEQYLRSIMFLSFLTNQIKSDLLWIRVNNKWRWVNYWR